jgi:hypothetical protein
MGGAYIALYVCAQFKPGAVERGTGLMPSGADIESDVGATHGSGDGGT